MVKIIKEAGVENPEYATAGASGMDVTAHKILTVYRGNKEISPENLERVRKGFEERGVLNVRAWERVLLGTGIKLELPENLEAQVRPRSGNALKRGLTVLNSPGTIDSDYQGEVGVILFNSSPFLAEINKGERIAQLVLAKVEKPSRMFIDENTHKALETERSTGGFGSTGK